MLAKLPPPKSVTTIFSLGKQNLLKSKSVVVLINSSSVFCCAIKLSGPAKKKQTFQKKTDADYSFQPRRNRHS